MDKKNNAPSGDCRRSCCGGCIVGPLLMFAMVAVTGEAPEMGGIFLMPFFIVFGVLLVWIAIFIYESVDEIWQHYRKRR